MCIEDERVLRGDVYCVHAGTIVDDMVELLCSNLQKNELAAINASLSTEDVTAAAKEALLKVSSPCPIVLPPSIHKPCSEDHWQAALTAFWLSKMRSTHVGQHVGQHTVLVVLCHWLSG